MIIDKIVILSKDIIELGGVILSWINTNVIGSIGYVIKPIGLIIIKILGFAITAVEWVINKV